MGSTRASVKMVAMMMPRIPLSKMSVLMAIRFVLLLLLFLEGWVVVVFV